MDAVEASSNLRARPAPKKKKAMKPLPSGAIVFGPHPSQLTKKDISVCSAEKALIYLREIAQTPENREVKLRMVQKYGDTAFAKDRPMFDKVGAHVNWDLLMALCQTDQPPGVKLEALTVIAVFTRHSSFPATRFANSDSLRFLLSFLCPEESGGLRARDREWVIRIFLVLMKSRVEIRDFLLGEGILQAFTFPGPFFSRFLALSMKLEPDIPAQFQDAFIATVMAMLGSEKDTAIKPLLAAFKKRPALFWMSPPFFEIITQKVITTAGPDNAVLVLRILERCRRADPAEFATRIPYPLYLAHLVDLINRHKSQKVQTVVLKVLIKNHEAFREFDTEAICASVLEAADRASYANAVLCTNFLVLYHDMLRRFEPHIVELVLHGISDKGFAYCGISFLVHLLEKLSGEARQVVLELCSNSLDEIEAATESENEAVADAAMSLLSLVSP